MFPSIKAIITQHFKLIEKLTASIITEVAIMEIGKTIEVTVKIISRMPVGLKSHRPRNLSQYPNSLKIR